MELWVQGGIGVGEEEEVGNKVTVVVVVMVGGGDFFPTLKVETEVLKSHCF